MVIAHTAAHLLPRHRLVDQHADAEQEFAHEERRITLALGAVDPSFDERGDDAAEGGQDRAQDDGGQRLCMGREVARVELHRSRHSRR